MWISVPEVTCKNEEKKACSSVLHFSFTECFIDAIHNIAF